MSDRAPSTEQNRPLELTFRSDRPAATGVGGVELNAIVTDPDGSTRTIPAFWAGGDTWRLRYASPILGRHQIETRCSDSTNAGLHGQQATIRIEAYVGNNPLFTHGPLVRASAVGISHLRHHDGTPFFWLADTWWMALVDRLPADGFRQLAEDRVEKGFTAAQLVAGLYPDMPAFDPRGTSGGTHPFEADFLRIDPGFFDAADQRIALLVELGLMPVIVGAWGYYLELAGAAAMRSHWRNLIARYGAYPVAWCAAGEAMMPFYDSPLWDDLWLVKIHRDAVPSERVTTYQKRLRTGWTEITRYVRSLDGFQRPLTIHPGTGGRWSWDHIDDPTLLDFDITQCGLHDLLTFPQVIGEVSAQAKRQPRLPRFLGESCYEGEGGWNWENVQRLMFWACMLSGAAGHTYGASGIWQVNTKEQPFGHDPRVFGAAFDDDPWDTAMHFPGSQQVGLGKQLLDELQWWRFAPQAGWTTHIGGDYFAPLEGAIRPYAAGIEREVRVIFAPIRTIVTVRALEPDVDYSAFYFDPRQGRRFAIGSVDADNTGSWLPPRPPIIQDWVLVLRATKE